MPARNGKPMRCVASLRRHYHGGHIDGVKRGGRIELDLASLTDFLAQHDGGRGGYRHGVRGTKRRQARAARVDVQV